MRAKKHGSRRTKGPHSRARRGPFIGPHRPRVTALYDLRVVSLTLLIDTCMIHSNTLQREAMSIFMQERTDSIEHQPSSLQVILVAISHTGLREALLSALAEDGRYYVHPVSNH